MIKNQPYIAALIFIAGYMMIHKGAVRLMGMDKAELLNALDNSFKELRQGIDTHHGLVTSILEDQVDERCLMPLFNLCPRRSRERLLEESIKEAIRVIEDIRKNFASKELDELRKKLAHILLNNE